MVQIRAEAAHDAAAIRSITVRAFEQSVLGYHGEADLIDRLRCKCPSAVSLVAELESRIVGHILFSPVVIEDSQAPGRHELGGMGLAPMSVLPGFQRQGIGSRLVESGLRIVREAGHPFVVVLGHPEYYTRFGFVPASGWGVSSEYGDTADDAFLIRVLLESALSGIRGIAKYQPEFGLL